MFKTSLARNESGTMTYHLSVILRHLRQLRTSSNVDVLSPAEPTPSLLPPHTPINSTIAAVNAGMHIWCWIRSL